MKINRLCVLCFVNFFLCCSKPEKPLNPSDPPTPADPIQYTPTPVSTPVNSTVMVYVIDNSQSYNPIYVLTDKIEYPFWQNFQAFNSGVRVFDRYYSRLNADVARTDNYFGYSNDKIFTVASSFKNYVDVKIVSPDHDGHMDDIRYSTTINLSNDGKLILPPYSIATNPSQSSFEILTKYFSPTIKDYAVSIPCYNMADENTR